MNRRSCSLSLQVGRCIGSWHSGAIVQRLWHSGEIKQMYSGIVVSSFPGKIWFELSLIPVLYALNNMH